MQKKYFARANTSSGCVNLMMNNLKGILEVYGVGGCSKTAKSALMEIVANHFADSFCVECVMSPFDIKTYDAVIIRDIKIALVDETLAEDIAFKKIIDTDSFLNMKKTGVRKSFIDELIQNEAAAISGLYKAYKEAKVIHDEWESIYNKNMDFERLENYSKGIIEELIGDNKGKMGTYKYERFFGASTVDGSVNYINNLTEKLNTRYFIKGRPGTGKSTFLKKLLHEAEAKGFGAEVYYCSFDKNSLDMVIVPELSFCVFDSTAPHEMFPEGKRDFVLDFYEESGLSGVDEKYEKQLELVSWRYRHRISEGLAHLRLSSLCMSEREFYLEKGIDFKKISQAADKLIRKING